jgi:4-amino-4-deoxy-L-arabinose transferase-like glycosyltransferase
MNRSHAAILLLTVAVAAFFRFYRLDSIPPGFHSDEAVDGNDALIAWRSGAFHVFYPENNGREGLVIGLQALALGAIGQVRPWVVRLPSALFGTLTVVGLYGLARQLGLQRTAWLAAWLMAVSFWQVDISRFGTRVAAAPCFLVWSLWLGGEAVNKQRRWWLWAVGAGLVFGLGFYTYTAYRVTPLLMLLVVRRYPKRVTLIAGMVALVVVAPLAVYAMRQHSLLLQRASGLPPLHLGDLPSNTWKTVAMFNFTGDHNPRHNIPGRALLWWPVGLLFIVGLVVAARRQRLLVGWLAIGILPAILANEGVPHAWRAILAAPPTYLLAALGADWLAERYRWHALLPAVAAVVAVEAYRSYFIIWARDPWVATQCDRQFQEIAALLDTPPRELPRYVVLDVLGTNSPTVRGLPIGAQTVMFLTDTVTPDKQELRNLHYLRLDQTNQIQHGFLVVYPVEVLPP